MNFEEMLNAQEGTSLHREKMPLGVFCRRQLDGKFRYVIEVRPQLADSLLFVESFKQEQQWAATQQKNKYQLHYEWHADSGEQPLIVLAPGQYQSISNLLEANPAVVATRGFVDHVVASLFDALSLLHSQQVFQCCLAPQNVFVHKGDNSALLLSHGSFYGAMKEPLIYEGYEDFVAPEVLAGQKADERSDVFALGRFIAFLFEQGSMPYEYKTLVKKATAANPAKRFKSLDSMKDALSRKRNARRSLLMLGASVIIALLAVFIYLDMVPQTASVEFVEPAKRTTVEDILEGRSETGLDLDGDSLMTPEEDAMYQKKAEDIYRKRYQKAADEILSKVYNNERMSVSEKKFMAGSQSMAEELVKVQKKLAEEAGLPDGVAGRIGHEIVEKLTYEKQQQLTRNNYLKAEESE